MKGIDKLTDWLFGILVTLRVFPWFALAFIWFERDPFYIDVLRFSMCILCTLCAGLILLLLIKLKSRKLRLFFAGLWLLAEIIWLSHSIIKLFSTDDFNTYLIAAGFMAAPFIVHKISKTRHIQFNILKLLGYGKR